jgi:NitT/TauT family transport system permease protein
MKHPGASLVPFDGAVNLQYPAGVCDCAPLSHERGILARVIAVFGNAIGNISGAHAAGIVIAVGLLLLWQFGSGVLFNAYYLSRPSAIAAQIAAWSADGYLWRHLSATLLNTAVGFALAALTGTAVALLLGGVKAADRVFGPLIYIVYSLPKVVLAPLLILWVGVGPLPVILMSFVTSFFMVFFNVYSGVRAVNPALLNSVALMGAGRFTTAFKVRLPAARASVALGMHQGLVYAFHGAIIGEMTSSDKGLGYALVYAGSDMDANGVLAVLAVLGIVAFGLLRTIGYLLKSTTEVVK